MFALVGGVVQPEIGQTPHPPEICSMPFQSVGMPLTELGSNEYIRMDGRSTGYSGGLYPNGSNLRPPQHEAAGLVLSRQIQPLAMDGQVDEEGGRILLISIGMSNTASEFEAFIRLVQRQPAINPQLVLINGALPNQIAERWANPEGIAWQELDRKITAFGFSSQQVQVAWVKLTNTGGGDFPQKAMALQADLQTIVQNLREKFPNLKLVFLSSRTRSYTYGRGLSPEPLAYETGFAVKWLIEKQIQGHPDLNFDPDQGEVKAVYLSWGPYLWADGENPREDGFLWLPSDLTSDCTHPSPAGADKIGQELWDFFSTDSITRDWFLLPDSSLLPTIQREVTHSPKGIIPTTPSVKLLVETETTPLHHTRFPTHFNPLVTLTNGDENDGTLPNNSLSPEAGITLLAALVSVSALFGWWRGRRKDKP